MSTRCANCGVESELDEAFEAGNQFGHPYCPSCILKTRGEDVTAVKWVFPIALVISVSGIWFDTEDDTGWAILNTLLFYVFGYASLIIHEAGHAIMGKALGLRVTNVQLGFGRTFMMVKAMDVRWEFKMIPFGGFARYIPIDLPWFRTKDFLTSFGGPLANLLVAWIMSWPIQAGAEFTKPVFGELHLWHVFLGTNLFSGLWNLIPYVSGNQPTDGMLMLRAPFIRDEQIKKLRLIRWQMECDLSLEEGEFDKALQQVEEGRKLAPDDPELASRKARALLGAQRFDEARSEALGVYEIESLSLEARARSSNTVAEANLQLDDEKLVHEAGFHSNHVMRIIPWDPEAKTVRAHLLIRQDEVDEAIPLLHSALEEESEPRPRAMMHCLLALAAHKKSDQSAYQAELSNARAAQPDHFMIAKVEKPAT